MNTRRVQRDIPKTPRTPQNTNFAGGRGRGGSPTLGRRTFIDDLVDRANSSTKAWNWGSSSVRRGPVTPRLGASVSTVENTREVVTPSGVTADRDRGNDVGGGDP